jgi:hypothetical protein
MKDTTERPVQLIPATHGTSAVFLDESDDGYWTASVVAWAIVEEVDLDAGYDIDPEGTSPAYRERRVVGLVLADDELQSPSQVAGPQFWYYREPGEPVPTQLAVDQERKRRHVHQKEVARLIAARTASASA